MNKAYGKLLGIQGELKAPKNQRNTFGNYSYRNAEDILEAVKPLCNKWKATLTISDDIVAVGNRIYVKATATLTDIETGENVEVSAMAREAEDKKGFDSAQVTGSTSSYARKYALNGLFCIDDTKDADAYDNRPQTNTMPPQQQVHYEANSGEVEVYNTQQLGYRQCECGNNVQEKLSSKNKVYAKCDSCGAWVN